MEEGTKIFKGFRTPNYTQVPDEIMDLLLPLLSGAELKVLLYICRRTFGFKKDSDAISLNQIATGIITRDGRVLDVGTGLSKRHVQRAIKRLEELSAVRILRQLGQVGENETNVYTLNFIDGGVGTKSPYGRDMDVVGVGTPVSTTRYSKQDKEINVNVGLVKNGGNDSVDDDDKTDSEAYLLSEIVRHTGDTNPKSLLTFRKVIRGLGSGVAETVLVSTKEAYAAGKVPARKRAAYFIGTAKKVAEEHGKDLGFKNGANRMYAGVANLDKAKIGHREIVSGMKIDRDDAD